MRLRVNRIVKYLILSDLLFWTGWGLINPIFAIFVVQRIEGGSAFVAGVAAAIYWILKSFLRVPIGAFLDSLKGEKDDYFFLVSGLFLAALVPFGYVIVRFPWQIYLLQVIYAIGMAMSLSGWQAIFTRHIDKGKEATEWGLDATFLGFGVGIAGAVGGWTVTKFGFEPVFISVGILGLVSVFVLLGLRNDIKGVFDQGIHLNFKSIFKGDSEK
ncbi:MFS transporter [bacterium]|nr:MFS transporter [bacterium]